MNAIKKWDATAGLDIKEWSRERFLHEIEKSKEDKELVKQYMFFLELLDSEYWEADLKEKGLGWLNESPKGKWALPDKDVVNVTLFYLCEELIIESRRLIMVLEKDCEELERQGKKILSVGPRGIEFIKVKHE